MSEPINSFRRYPSLHAISQTLEFLCKDNSAMILSNSLAWFNQEEDVLER